jgi:DNA-binding transcriptional regulator GbsR (MarR family)
MSFNLNSSLSWEARGLLNYLLLTSPDDFVISEIIKASPSGRDKVSSILSELVRAKYVHRWQERGANGLLMWRSKTFDRPVAGETWISEYFEDDGKQVGGCHEHIN